MKSFVSILLIFSMLPTWAQVERYGGWDLMDYAEGAAGGSWLCDQADQEEFRYINCNGGYRYQQPQAITNFDAATEELVFMDAARRAHDFTRCQQTLFDELGSNATKRNELFTNGWAQFDQSLSTLRQYATIVDEQGALAASIRSGMSFAEDKGNALYTRQARALEDAQARKSDALGKLNTALARVPLGNRPEMREELLRMVRTTGPVSQSAFMGGFRQGLERLTNEARRSTTYFNGIFRQQGTNQLYRVDETLKKTLVRTGQIDNVLTLNGTREQLEDSFMCRARRRYKNGERNLTLIEIPLYFAGAYGLGRLALRAGVAGVAAVEAGMEGAALAANATLWSARAAMIGMDAAQWLKVGAEVRNACFPEEFFTAIQAGQCSAESEVNGIYQEAQISQCVSASMIGLTPLAFVGGMRLWQARRGIATSVDTPTTPERAVLGTATEADRPMLTVSSELESYLGTRPSLKARVDANPQLFRVLAGDVIDQTRLTQLLRDFPDSAQVLEDFMRRMAGRQLTQTEARQLETQMESLYRRVCPL